VLLWDNKSQNDRPLLPNSHQVEDLMQDNLLAVELFKRGVAFEDAFDNYVEADSATPNIVAHNLANTEACLTHGNLRIDICILPRPSLGLMRTSILLFPDQAASIPFFRRCRKALFGIARERSAFVDSEAVEAATSHIRLSSVIAHTGGCEPVDPSRCWWTAGVDHPYYFPPNMSPPKLFYRVGTPPQSYVSLWI
jgi:hypothetical protein